MPARERARVGAAAAAFAVAYALIGLFRHWHFGSNAFDLGIFDQVVWHLSRFETPASTIAGHANIFGDHFHPIIGLFAPLYWIAPAAETLIVAQAILLAASVVPVYAFLRSRLTAGITMSVTVAYGLSWGLQRTAWFDVHELAFAPLLIGCAVWALDQRRWPWLWGAVIGLLLVKEDMPLVCAGIGGYLILTGERRRGAAICAVSTAVFLLAVGVVVPALNDDGVYVYSSGFGALMSAPWTAPVVMVTPIEKLRTVLFWLAPFAFLPLRSPVVLMMVPIAAARLLSSSPSHWHHGFHYSAPLAPFLAMAAGDGLARIAAGVADPVRRRRLVLAAVSLSVVVSATLPGHQPILRLFAAKHYRPVSFQAEAREALAVIPAGASVVAQSPIVPHLSQRAEIYVLDDTAPDAEFVVASTDVAHWPLASHDEVRRLVAQRRARGYQTVFERGNWVVLKRPA